MQVCPICIQPFENTDQKYPRVMTCGHSVCSECIKLEIRKYKCITCPICKDEFSKQECVQFKLNHEFISMLETLMRHFGKSFFVYTMPQDQFSHEQRVNENLSLGLDSFGEVKKCKHSPCFNQTDLIFCSEQCRTHFEEVQTNKNQGGFQKRKFSN